MYGLLTIWDELLSVAGIAIFIHISHLSMNTGDKDTPLIKNEDTPTPRDLVTPLTELDMDVSAGQDQTNGEEQPTGDGEMTSSKLGRDSNSRNMEMGLTES